VVLASLALLLLAYVPGAALAWAATAPGSRARYALLGVSPALTLGVVGAAFGWSGALGLDWSALTILLIEVVVAVAAMAARADRGGGRRGGHGGSGPPAADRRTT